MFPEEAHYEVDGDTLLEVRMVHTGGGSYEPIYGDSWNITNISPIHKGITNDWFTFEQNGDKYKATINRKYKQSNGCYIVDLSKL